MGLHYYIVCTCATYLEYCAKVKAFSERVKQKKKRSETMAAALLRFAHACQVALCCYGGYQSCLAITNLQKYEQTTKKLAKWSQQVDEQLRKTQTTQASGAAAVFASLVASSILTFVPPSTLPVWLHFCISPALLAGVFFCAWAYAELLGSFRRQDGRHQAPIAQHGRV